MAMRIFKSLESSIFVFLFTMKFFLFILLTGKNMLKILKSIIKNTHCIFCNIIREFLFLIS